MFPMMVPTAKQFQDVILMADRTLEGRLLADRCEPGQVALVALGYATKWQAVVRHARKLTRRSQASRNPHLQAIKDAIVINSPNKKMRTDEALEDDDQHMDEWEADDDSLLWEGEDPLDVNVRPLHTAKLAQ